VSNSHYNNVVVEVSYKTRTAFLSRETRFSYDEQRDGIVHTRGTVTITFTTAVDRRRRRRRCNFIKRETSLSLSRNIIAQTQARSFSSPKNENPFSGRTWRARAHGRIFSSLQNLDDPARYRIPRIAYSFGRMFYVQKYTRTLYNCM